MLRIKQVIKNAEKTALREGYDHLVFIDNHSEYSFTRKYFDLNNPEDVKKHLWDMVKPVCIVHYSYSCPHIKVAWL